MLEEGVLIPFFHFPMLLSRAFNLSDHHLSSLVKEKIVLTWSRVVVMTKLDLLLKSSLQNLKQEIDK